MSDVLLNALDAMSAVIFGRAAPVDKLKRDCAECGAKREFECSPNCNSDRKNAPSI